ncbi:PAS domain S-box protein [Nitrospina watsonii]|uniref:histidine kinase n=1 Tax=Nitrospina watsonii TaxID=1323948 RepID=A0ABM9HEP4_9BACT|nr:PAS domain S-box protein [Nitrospina watsonii]CAI2718613.1 Putative Histidine kinase [Nitrospina watsonii]
MSKKNEHIASQVGVTLIVALVLLVGWEYALKQIFFELLLNQPVDQSAFQRWEFVIACLAIVALSITIPFSKVRKLLDELKSVEESLVGEKTLSRIFFNVDSSILIVVDTNNQIMQVNKKALKILGYKEDDLLGKDWMQFLIRSKERDALRREFIAFVNDRSRNFKAFSTPVHDKSNQEHRVEWQAAPLVDERDQVYGTIISGLDVTQQNTAIHELNALKDKYQPALKKLTQELEDNKQKYHQEAIKTAHAKARFKYWFNLEKTLIALTPEDFSNKAELDERIRQTLEDFGSLCSVDHGFVYMLSPGRESMANSHIWVSDEPHMEPDSDPISLSDLPWLKKKLLKLEVLHIPDVAALPKEAAAEKKFLDSQGVKSIVLAPLGASGGPIGCLGFETINEPKAWDSDEIEILKMLARQMTRVFHTSDQIISDQPLSTSQPDDESIEGFGFDLDDDVLGLDFEDAAMENDIKETGGKLEQGLKEQIANLEKARATLEAKLEDSNTAESQLRAAQNELENKLHTKSEELDRLTELLAKEKETKQRMEEQLAEDQSGLKQKYEEVQEQLQSIQAKLEEEVQSKKQLESQLASNQQALEKELQEKRQADKPASAADKTAFATNLEKQLSNKSLELQKVQGQLENITRTKEKLEEKLKIDRNVLEKKLADKEAEIEELKAQMETAENSKMELGYKASKTRSRGKTEEEKAQEEQQEAERQEELQILTLKLSQYQSELEEKDAEMKELRQQFSEFKTNAPSPHEIETLQAQIDSKDLEVQQLQETLDEVHVAKNWVETELSKLRKDMEKLEENFEVLEASRTVLQTEIEEFRQIQTQFEQKNQEYQELQHDTENLEIANQQMMTDLEEKDRLIEELRYQSQRLDQVGLPLFTMNTRGVIMTWNQGAQTLTGYYQEAAQGQPISFLFPKDEDIQLQRDVLDPLKENGAVNLLLPLSFGNGNHEQCEKGLISLALFTNGTASDEAIGVIADISNDRKAEEALQSLKDYYDSMLKKSGLISVTLSADFEITEFGPAAETALGWTPQNAGNRNFFEKVMPDKDWKGFAATTADQLKEKSVFQFESDTPVDNSTKHTMVWNLIRESHDSKTPGSILAIGQDIHEMRERENNIKEREALLASIIDQAVDGFVTIDESGIIQSFNSTAETMFGYSSSEVVGRNISMLMPEPYRSEHGNYLSRYMQTGKANLVGKEPREFPGQAKDGTVFPIEVAVREIYQGYRRMFVGIIHDVRKRKQFEITSRENEEKFRKLLEAETDAIFMVNLADNRILEGNEASAKLFGYNRNELPKLKYTDLFINGSTTSRSGGQSGALGLGPRKKSDLGHFNKKDGTVFPAQVTSSSFVIQNEKLSLYIVRDMTPQLKAEETIQESERHLSDILNQAALPIYIKDMEGRYLLANNAFQKLFNIRSNQLLGKTDHEVFPADIADILVNTDRQALETGQNVESNESILHDDGIHNYTVIKHPMRNSAGVLYGVCGILNDNSPRTRLESELARMRTEFQDRLDHYLQSMAAQHEKHVLSERSSAAAQAMTGLANQISNPIHGIQNILEQLSDRAAMEEIHKGLMTVALNECRRVADLSEQLQRCDIPKLDESEAVDLHALLHEFTTLEDNKTDPPIQFEEHLTPNLKSIEGNRAQVKLALQHVFQNALEANSGQSGKIVIATELVEDKVRVHIQDTGCGIPEEIRGRIFDPFFTTKKASKRAGLGLMMVLGVIKNHGGDIDVHSEAGKGTTVTLSLPLKQK